MREKITEGSGSVYQDSGFEHPEEWEAKARLASNIMLIIQDRGSALRPVGLHVGSVGVRLAFCHSFFVPDTDHRQD